MSQSRLFAIYVDSFRVSADAAPVVGSQLQRAMPQDVTEEEKRRCEAIRLEAEHIASELGARERAMPAAVRREKDACVGAWTGCFEIIGGKARLDPTTEDGAAARELSTKFFADGVPVSQRTATETYGISSRLLQRIADEKLGDLLELVVGTGMVALLRSTTEALGDALGAGQTRRAPMPSGTGVQEALARYGKKVAAYCRLLLAKVDEDDPRSVQRFFDAVAPIDAYRASARGATDGGDDAEKPSMPVTNGVAGMPGGSPFVTTA